MLSRRVLETLTYLARNHPYVAKIMLQLKLSKRASELDAGDARGKSVIIVEDDENSEYVSIAMLLSLLNQPLYLRSIAHLEQVMIWNLLGILASSSFPVPADFALRM